jgi:hypothetical protein
VWLSGERRARVEGCRCATRVSSSQAHHQKELINCSVRYHYLSSGLVSPCVPFLLRNRGARRPPVASSALRLRATADFICQMVLTFHPTSFFSTDDGLLTVQRLQTQGLQELTQDEMCGGMSHARKWGGSVSNSVHVPLYRPLNQLAQCLSDVAQGLSKLPTRRRALPFGWQLLGRLY